MPICQGEGKPVRACNGPLPCCGSIPRFVLSLTYTNQSIRIDEGNDMLDFVLELVGDILDQLFLTPWV